MTNDIQYHLPMYERLQPKSAWQASPMTHTDVLSLTEAAALASEQAGKTVTPEAFLRAAAKGQIQLMAVVHRAAETVPCRPDDAALGPVPAGAILNLPVDACRQLSNAGRAAWRTFDDYELQNGVLCSFARWMLAQDEPDFETTTDDCRVWGLGVHGLADIYRQDETPEPVQVSKPAPHQPEPVSRFRRLERMDELAEIIFRVLQRWEDQGRKGIPSGGVIRDMILTDESAKGLVTPSADGLIFHGENGDLSMTKKALRKRAGYMAR